MIVVYLQTTLTSNIGQVFFKSWWAWHDPVGCHAHIVVIIGLVGLCFFFSSFLGGGEWGRILQINQLFRFIFCF